VQAVTQTITAVEAKDRTQRKFEAAGIGVAALDLRAYPEETIIVVRVMPETLTAATDLANDLDNELASLGFQGFVTVRADQKVASSKTGVLKRGVFDARALDLANLLTARSRTSEAQPSLTYIRDAADSLSAATASRHHLIFGRRGSGKTALMVEAKRAISEQGDLSVWLNLQTLRDVTAAQGFLWFVQELAASVQGYYAAAQRAPFVLSQIASLSAEATLLLAKTPDPNLGLLVPRVQRLIKRFLETESKKLFIFVDELHYLRRDVQPRLLDSLHGAVRDADAWMKIAGIRHLMRWFVSSPTLGLQTGQDADHINLDITLENPAKGKTFLETMLKSYAQHVGIQSLLSLFSREALDRLILASGAVPRDYLVLSAAAIREAQKRQKAKTVGVQDVNRVAGDAAKVKIAELQDDAAAAEDASQRIAGALEIVREFCISERSTTYFRVDFRDKELRQGEYSLLQDLMDLRLLHLIDSSVSDEKEAGRRFEVYVLDLSQYSGQRLKKKLRVLDFNQGRIVLKETGVGAATRVAETANQRLAILRRGPAFALSALTTLINVDAET
jgi:hypothetical protein